MLLPSLLISALPPTSPVKVEVVHVGSRWELRRNGKPYYVKGAGGAAHLDQLVAAGGNSFRTWGTETASFELDEAQRLGLTVSLGIWLGHKSYFDYENKDQVKKQFDMVEREVRLYAERPALLVWGLGNEMEAEGDNDTPAVWQAIEDLARLTKRLDPNHPTMTVVAEVNKQKIDHIKRFAPSIDILGVNTYGGLPTLPNRLAEFGWDKPYLVTEFGAKGQWESPKTPWGAAIEPTSSQKAETFIRNYVVAIRADSARCLGSYVFYWGSKTEETPTWFGMFLPSSERTATVDAMTYLWSGKWPAYRAPTITPIECSGTEFVAGETVSAAIKSESPYGSPIVATWTVRAETKVKRFAGEGEKAEPERRPESLQITDQAGFRIKFKAPSVPGPYRLFVTVRDARGAAAVANIAFRVR